MLLVKLYKLVSILIKCISPADTITQKAFISSYCTFLIFPNLDPGFFLKDPMYMRLVAKTDSGFCCGSDYNIVFVFLKLWSELYCLHMNVFYYFARRLTCL